MCAVVHVYQGNLHNDSDKLQKGLLLRRSVCKNDCRKDGQSTGPDSPHQHNGLQGMRRTPSGRTC
jgi:hypothetical protein